MIFPWFSLKKWNSMIFPYLEFFFAFFQVFHDISSPWAPCYFPNASCAGTCIPFQSNDTHIIYRMFVKNSKFHRTLLPLWSVLVCAVLPASHWLLLRLAWNNGKLLTQASFWNGARTLNHCDVIASLASSAEWSWHSKSNIIYGHSLGPNTSRVVQMNCI